MVTLSLHGAYIKVNEGWWTSTIYKGYNKSVVCHPTHIHIISLCSLGESALNIPRYIDRGKEKVAQRLRVSVSVAAS